MMYDFEDIEYRQLKVKGKCHCCNRPIERNTEKVVCFTSLVNAKWTSIHICDKCMNMINTIRSE